MRTYLPLFLGLAALTPGPAIAAEAGGYSCTIDSTLNTSTGETLAPEDTEVFHALSDLKRDGAYLVQREVVDGIESESDTTHRIDPATGEYRATTFLTHHGMGEQYVLETSGTCKLLAGDD